MRQNVKYILQTFLKNIWRVLFPGRIVIVIQKIVRPVTFVIADDCTEVDVPDTVIDVGVDMRVGFTHLVDKSFHFIPLGWIVFIAAA